MKTTGNNITKDENPFESLHNLIVFSPTDFSQTVELAWFYGIIIGWDDEECFREFEKQFTRWNKKDSLRLKKLHDNFVRIARENGAECYKSTTDSCRTGKFSLLHRRKDSYRVRRNKMKAKHYLLLSFVFSILSFIAFTLWSLIFLARKMPVFFAISIIGALCAVHMVYLSIKEIRTRHSDLGVNKNDKQ